MGGRIKHKVIVNDNLRPMFVDQLYEVPGQYHAARGLDRCPFWHAAAYHIFIRNTWLKISRKKFNQVQVGQYCIFTYKFDRITHWPAVVDIWPVEAAARLMLRRKLPADLAKLVYSYYL